MEFVLQPTDITIVVEILATEALVEAEAAVEMAVVVLVAVVTSLNVSAKKGKADVDAFIFKIVRVSWLDMIRAVFTALFEKWRDFEPLHFLISVL